MKKQFFLAIVLCISIAFQPLLSNATVASASSSTVVLSDSLEANKLLVRLYEINEMDKTNLTTKEKKALRKEVKGIQSGLKDIGKGVYLSIGAIIIIILLLILILN